MSVLETLVKRSPKGPGVIRGVLRRAYYEDGQPFVDVDIAGTIRGGNRVPVMVQGGGAVTHTTVPFATPRQGQRIVVVLAADQNGDLIAIGALVEASGLPDKSNEAEEDRGAGEPAAKTTTMQDHHAENNGASVTLTAQGNAALAAKKGVVRVDANQGIRLSRDGEADERAALAGLVEDQIRALARKVIEINAAITQLKICLSAASAGSSSVVLSGPLPGAIADPEVVAKGALSSSHVRLSSDAETPTNQR